MSVKTSIIILIIIFLLGSVFFAYLFLSGQKLEIAPDSEKAGQTAQEEKETKKIDDSPEAVEERRQDIEENLRKYEEAKDAENPVDKNDLEEKRQAIEDQLNQSSENSGSNASTSQIKNIFKPIEVKF